MIQFFKINRIKMVRLCVCDDRGSALVACMLVLVVLSTLGVIAVQTSVTETKIAANEQFWEEDFNISEGGAAIEGGKIGFAGPLTGAQWYEISDPSLLNQLLLPPNNSSYDPGGDIDDGNFPDDFLSLPDTERTVTTRMWPHQNIRQDALDDQFDYAYLVTYLGTSEKMLKSYDAGKFAAYQFRINGVKQSAIELGGIKIGVKPM